MLTNFISSHPFMFLLIVMVLGVLLIATIHTLLDREANKEIRELNIQLAEEWIDGNHQQPSGKSNNSYASAYLASEDNDY